MARKSILPGIKPIWSPPINPLAPTIPVRGHRTKDGRWVAPTIRKAPYRKNITKG